MCQNIVNKTDYIIRLPVSIYIIKNILLETCNWFPNKAVNIVKKNIINKKILEIQDQDNSLKCKNMPQVLK